VTLLAGLITTLAALFPALVMKLLDFVALYGLVLIPMGGVIFADFYLMKKFGLKDYYAERMKINFNWAAGLTWFILLAAALLMNRVVGVELYFLPLPAWVLAVGLFMLLSKFYQKKAVL
jgi:purine-cytosine permease-like protein